MKKFRISYSPLVLILIFAVVLISAAGLITNVITVINYLKSNFFLAVVYGALTLLTALLFSESLAIVFYGRYVFKKGKLYSFFGFIYSKTDVKEVAAVQVFKKTDKLVLYFTDEKYTVILIPPEKYGDFIVALLKENPDVKYLTGDESPA